MPITNVPKSTNVPERPRITPVMMLTTLKSFLCLEGCAVIRSKWTESR
jgi:hypothetical protein